MPIFVKWREIVFILFSQTYPDVIVIVNLTFCSKIIMATPLAVAGEAMETLKMKIFMLKKENTDVTEKMQEAEKVVYSGFVNH